MSAKKTRKSSRVPSRTPTRATTAKSTRRKRHSSDPVLSHPPSLSNNENPLDGPARTIDPQNISNIPGIIQPPPGFPSNTGNMNHHVNYCPIPTQPPPIQNILQQYTGDREFSFEEISNLASTLRKELDHHRKTCGTIEIAQERLTDIEEDYKSRGNTGVINFSDDPNSMIIQPPPPNEDINRRIQRGSNGSAMKGRASSMKPPVKRRTSTNGVKGKSKSNGQLPPEQLLIHLSPTTPTPSGNFPSVLGPNIEVAPPPAVIGDAEKSTTPTSSTNGVDDLSLTTSGERKRKRSDETMEDAPDPKKQKVSANSTPSSSSTPKSTKKKKAGRLPTGHPSSSSRTGPSSNFEKKKKNVSKYNPRSPHLKRRTAAKSPSITGFLDDDDDFYREDEEKVSLTTSVQFWKYVDSFFEPLDGHDKLKELDPSPNHFHLRMASRIYHQTMNEDNLSPPPPPGKGNLNTPMTPQQQLQQLKYQRQKRQLEVFDPLGNIPSIGEHYSIRWAKEDVANDEMVDGDNIDDSWSTMTPFGATHHHDSFNAQQFPGNVPSHPQYPYGSGPAHHLGQGDPDLPHQQQQGMPYATRSRRRNDDAASLGSFNQKIIEVPSTSKVFEDNSLTMRLMNSLIEERPLPKFSSNTMQNLNPSNYLMLQLQKQKSKSEESSSGGTKRTISAKRKKLMKDNFFQKITNVSKDLISKVDPKHTQMVQKNLKYSVKEYTAENVYKFDEFIEGQLKGLGIWDVDRNSFRNENEEETNGEERMEEDLNNDFNDEICLKIRELQQQLQKQYDETNRVKEAVREKILNRMDEEKEFRSKEDNYEMIKKEYERMFNKRKRSNR